MEGFMGRADSELDIMNPFVLCFGSSSNLNQPFSFYCVQIVPYGARRLYSLCGVHGMDGSERPMGGTQLKRSHLGGFHMRLYTTFCDGQTESSGEEVEDPGTVPPFPSRTGRLP